MPMRLRFTVFMLFTTAAITNAQPATAPVTPNASPEARALLQAIHRISAMALGEAGQVPSPAILKNQPKWAWLMIWADTAKSSKPGAIKELFDDPGTLSKGDKVP